MPAARKDTKALRIKRRDQFSPIDNDNATDIEECAIPVGATILTDEQTKLRNIIPALTPAHGPESTSSAILAALSLGNHRPNSHTRRKSDGHVNRPPNAFIVFRRAQVQNMPANITQHQQRISNLTASFWRVLTQSEQNTWYSLADDIKRLHHILFPDYNFNPRNPDGSKKPMLPRAGLTSERLDFAWKEAQELIRKHTVMGVHPPAPPACMIGKVPRPKVPRKGQGTRAKERREQEAAQRAATATIHAMEAAAMDAPLHQGEGGMMYHHHQYPPSIIEEESAAASPSDSAIAWRPDFSLEGSVSSKSSPTNSWTELVGPFDASSNTNNNNNEKVDPLDASTYESSLPSAAHAHAHAHANYDYGVTTPFDGPAIVVDEYSGMVTQARFVGSPFHQNHIGIGHSTIGSPQTHYMESTAIPHGGSYPPSMTKPIALPVSGMPVPVQKHTYIPMPVLDGNAGNMYYSAPVDVAASSANTSATNSNEYPMPTYTNCMGGGAGQVEAQFIFHDMDPTVSYFDMPSIYAGSAAAEYAW
ncbi:hypothetical protein FRC19_002296 [Serendipita sp. 401]|nr:hypothetical protein FRC19_002296 [Serendipita sp. 401]